MTAELPPELYELQLARSPYATLIARADDGTVLFTSDLVRESLGDIVGKTYYELGYWPDEAARQNTLNLARAPDGYSRRIDRGPEGESRPHVLTSRIIEVRGTEYLISTTVDIAPMIKVETDLKDTLERLERAQSIARIGDFLVDMDTQEVDGSAEFMRLLGYPAEAATFTVDELYERFHPDHLPAVRAAVDKMLEKGDLSIEHRLADDADSERWVHTRAYMEAGRDGRRMMRGAAQDITERKRAEQERERLLLKVQETQRLESLGLLSGGVAHDFNNLLAGILGNADFALLADNVPPEIEKCLTDIITASRRAADLTRQLLAYSGKGRFVIEPANLSDILREMNDLLRTTLNKDQTLHFFLEDNLPAVDADVTQIRQVLMNLIINATEAIEHDHGIVNITTGQQRCDADYLAASLATRGLSAELDPGDYVFVEVSDNGVGMDRATVERLYDPFFTTKFTGRGLGMAAVLGIVHGHRGGIMLDSELGCGTNFRILLPASDQQPATHDVERPAVGNWHGRGSVLVIDDEQTVRDFISTVLERFGYSVLSAQAGPQGLQCFKAHSDEVRLVLLDLSMQHMDGLETLTELKKIDPDVRAVLMSGYDEQDATAQFVAKDLAGFLAKPFLVKDLMEVVSAAFTENQ
ncbi:MAG: response regulator [Gammaproteobacteria bacterium]|nr:response regulator [Gammaproteobacteria bacterium]